MKPGDKYLWGFLLVLAGSAFWIASTFKLQETEHALFAQVRTGGAVVCRVRLDSDAPEERRFVPPDGPAEAFNVVRFEKGRARVVNANCPDQLCVRRGWISRDASSPAICLPHRFSLEIVSQTEKIGAHSDDAISY